jgi:hypothetical protein
MYKAILSKEEERILLNGRIDAIRSDLKEVPKWRRKLYAKNPIYQAKEFHVQNVLRNKSTNLELTERANCSRIQGRISPRRRPHK